MKTIKISYVMPVICAALLSCQNTGNQSSEMKDSSVLDSGNSSAKADVRGSKGEPDDPTHESKVDDDGAAFIKNAGIGGMMEVELGKLAQSKSANKKVKEFAAKMVTDHSKVNEELKTIARNLEIVVPSEYPADQKEHIDMMKKLDGTAFDKHYMNMMVNDHGKTIELFRSAISLRDDQLKAFAAKTLPVIESHHTLAKEITTSLK